MSDRLKRATLPQGEGYKEHPVYRGYFGHSEGFVYSSYHNGKILKQRIDVNGYQCVNVSYNNQGKKVFVHRFIADCFLSQEPGKEIVCHINKKPHDNRLVNLERRARATLPKNRGETNGRAKLKRAQVIEIKNRLSQGESQQKIAEAFNVSQVHIGRIAKGERWSHIKV